MGKGIFSNVQLTLFFTNHSFVSSSDAFLPNLNKLAFADVFKTMHKFEYLVVPVSNVVSLHSFNLSSYDSWPNEDIILVTLLWIPSNIAISFLWYGLRVCIQYSRYGATIDLYNGVLISSSIWTILLLTNLRIPLAFNAAVPRYSNNFQLALSVNLRSVSFLVIPISTFPIL